MSVLLGVTLPQFTDDPDRFVDGARRAEACGLDSIWVFDHIWPLTGGKRRPIIECWTALSWIAEATEKIRIGTLVTRSSLRHPAVLAKMAATVGAIAPGRTIVTIGSGDAASRAENEAYGIPYYRGERRIHQLTSSAAIVHAYLNHDVISIEDEFASISSLPASPRGGASKIWVGGRSDDVLEVAGTVADGWNGWAGTPKRFAQDAAGVLDYARGRAVELSWGGLVMLGRDDDDARAKLGNRSPSGWIVGGPETVADGLARFAEQGATHLIATLPDPWREGLYESLAERVRPRVG